MWSALYALIITCSFWLFSRHMFLGCVILGQCIVCKVLMDIKSMMLNSENKKSAALLNQSLQLVVFTFLVSYLIWAISHGIFCEFVFTLCELRHSGICPFSVSFRGTNSAWSSSRKNMNLKNNNRPLFNFFRPHLPIKAEQTNPATCERLLSS